MSTPDEGCPDLAVVIPTFNEAGNIKPLVDRLTQLLSEVSWEIIFVDDNSPDQTAEVIGQLARENRRIRCLQRLNRRGLSSACIEGFLSTNAPYVAVMDADLQHDESLLPLMLESLKSGDWDLAVASRYIEGGSNQGLAPHRAFISQFATRLARLLKVDSLSDPMSGFFMFQRSLFKPCFSRLYGEGFKILIDLVSATDSPIRTKEFPYEMRSRAAGESKMDVVVVGEYLMMLFVKLTMGKVPIKFMLFILVGLIGVGVHLSVLSTLQSFEFPHFFLAQAMATYVAMTSNFFINNLVTYRDQRLSGKKPSIRFV